jgi:hypothetical protein
MSVVPISISFIERSCARKSACGTPKRSSQAVLVSVATRFRSSREISSLNVRIPAAYFVEGGTCFALSGIDNIRDTHRGKKL